MDRGFYSYQRRTLRGFTASVIPAEAGIQKKVELDAATRKRVPRSGMTKGITTPLIVAG